MTTGTVLRHGHSLAVVVPLKYARELGWLAGQKLMLTVVDGQLVFTAMDRPRLALPQSRRLRQMREQIYAQ